jgi:PII-like signaling protein
MKGVTLKFYTYELDKYHDILCYEWLLKFAKSNGLRGGTIFRAIGGYGRSKVLHEEHYFELTSNQPIEIVFHIREDEATKFLELLKKQKVDLFYAKIASEFGSVSD